MDFSYAEGWRPSEGDTLIGTVQEVSMGHSEYGSYPIVTVKPEDGDAVAVHCFHTALLNRMMELQPKNGERIGFQYKGKQRTKDGKREVAVYVVRIEGRTESDVWARLGAAVPAPAPIPATDVPAAPADFAPAQPTQDDDIPF